MAPRISANWLGLALALLVVSCGGSGGGSRSGEPTGSGGSAGSTSSSAVTVDFALPRQRISGFGASSAWTAANLSDAHADQFFSTETGIGLSLLRLRIAPTGTTSEVATAKKALARGASIWAAPWSPPGEWKTNGSDRHGGRLLPERYGDWAQRLTNFVADLAEQGVPLLLLSAQNEPNWVAEWETCEWSPSELTAFVRDELGPRLSALGLATRILAPETNDWHTIATYGDTLLADADAAQYLGPIATHAYGGRAFAYKTPARQDKELWQTEVSDHDNVGDPGMDSALRIARMIHEHLTVAEVNAWHYWWLFPNSGTNDNSALTQAGQLTRRAYILGNWSRFVRPDFVRVTANQSSRRDVLVTAFRDPASRRFVLVAVNESNAAVTQPFALSDADFTSVTPFTTSAEFALAAGAPIAVRDGQFSALLASRSVTSLVADLADEPPLSGEGGAPATP